MLVLRPVKKYFVHIKTSRLLAKDYKFRPFGYLGLGSALKVIQREGSLSMLHSCRDRGFGFCNLPKCSRLLQKSKEL